MKRCNISTPEGREIAQTELKILQQFKEPNIVKLLAFDTSTVLTNNGISEALLLLEYCPRGHLLSRLNECQGVPLPCQTICNIFHQILLAVFSLHSHNPSKIHRDLKLENILFSRVIYIYIIIYITIYLKYK